MREVGLFSERVNVRENMSFSRLLRRVSTTEVFNRVLDTAVIKDNNRWRNTERRRGLVEGLINIAT